MKAFKFLVALMCMGSSLTAFAADGNENDDNQYEFKKHWFLNLQGGAQYTLGEAKFGDLISPNAQIGVGYQFNPWFATRLAVNAWQSKGGWSGYQTPKGPETTTYKFKYVAPGVDFMFNLSNAICGWNPKRVMNVSAFVGAAANIAFDNDEAQALAAQGYVLRYLWDGSKVNVAGRAGVAVDFRLSDAVTLGIEGNANCLSDHFNSKKAGNADWYFNALASVRINLGKTYTKKPVPTPPVVTPAPVEPAPVVKKEEVKPVIVEKKVVEKNIEVFFTIASSKIVDAESAKIAEMVEFLKANPEAKVTVTGYADVKTGNPKINMKYSQHRADVVKKALVEGGIAVDRIITEAKGDTAQPFAENDKNRVTICIAK